MDAARSYNELKKAEILREYDTDATQKCSSCARIFPLTPSFWHKDMKAASGYKSTCKECRMKIGRAEENQDILERADELEERATKIDGKATTFLNIVGDEASRIPHISELYEEMIRVFGGPTGLATRMLANFEAASEGSNIRKGILDSIIRLGDRVSESGAATVPKEYLEESDLHREAEKLMKSMMNELEEPA